jgi:hypothetical protein
MELIPLDDGMKLQKKYLLGVKYTTGLNDTSFKLQKMCIVVIVGLPTKGLDG